jgi:uncharacterized protein YecE (DUF72 family)
MSGGFLFGTQSWQFADWVDSFYPPGTKRKDMLRCYARMFRTLEVDSTFYGVPPEPAVRGWRESVPQDFAFALKVPQEITHMRRLVGAEELLDRFVNRVRLLDDALGPLLLQLSPDFLPSQTNRTALTSFLSRLSHDARWAVEFRHPDWLDDDTLQTLRDHNVALTLADGRWIRRRQMLEMATRPTADFAYVRWMGAQRSIRAPGQDSLGDSPVAQARPVGSTTRVSQVGTVGFAHYSAPQVDRTKELNEWADALRGLGSLVDTAYGYFNNQFQGHSPYSAREMMRLMGQKPVEPSSIRPQAELFQDSLAD